MEVVVRTTFEVHNLQHLMLHLGVTLDVLFW